MSALSTVVRAGAVGRRGVEGEGAAFGGSDGRAHRARALVQATLTSGKGPRVFADGAHGPNLNGFAEALGGHRDTQFPASEHHAGDPKGRARLSLGEAEFRAKIPQAVVTTWFGHDANDK